MTCPDIAALVEQAMARRHGIKGIAPNANRLISLGDLVAVLDGCFAPLLAPAPPPACHHVTADGCPGCTAEPGEAHKPGCAEGPDTFPRAPRDAEEREAAYDDRPGAPHDCDEMIVWRGVRTFCDRALGHDGDHVLADPESPRTLIATRWPSSPPAAVPAPQPAPVERPVLGDAPPRALTDAEIEECARAGRDGTPPADAVSDETWDDVKDSWIRDSRRVLSGDCAGLGEEFPAAVRARAAVIRARPPAQAPTGDKYHSGAIHIHKLVAQRDAALQSLATARADRERAVGEALDNAIQAAAWFIVPVAEPEARINNATVNRICARLTELRKLMQPATPAAKEE